MTCSNALALLQETYLSDNEEEQDDIVGGNHVVEHEEFPKLVIPESIRSFCPEDSDDVGERENPELHGGRIRSFPHEQGNWATCLFVPIHPIEELNLLYDTLISCTKLISDFHCCRNCHISVSKTVVLRHHWIQLFVDGIRKKTSKFKPFMIDFEDLDVYINEEKTRTFLGLKIKLGCDILLELIESVNKCMSEFNLPSYYENPSPHVSVLWCLGDREKDLISILPALRRQFNKWKMNNSLAWTVTADQLHCKIGNRLYQMEFDKRRE